MTQLQLWNFDNSYAQLPKHFFTGQAPIPVAAPKMVIFNDTLAEFLGVEQDLQVLAGNNVPPGAQPLAQAYMGHQFGHPNMLGDGRAILLGEQITPSGQRFDIQLKGSGRTPYSRRGDGRAALGPMLREYIISEAMYGLGIPTTRSLAVVATGETVLRERELSGAVLTRVAASHIRVGTFEYAAQFGSTEDVQTLADYTIARHFTKVETYLEFLQEVIRRQASLIAKWQLVGFIHGVMNTDNMAISGETIDYGPCAFMDTYHPNTVFSSIDQEGRYAYKKQPQMAVWNLARFAETLLPLLHDDEKTAVNIATEAINNFMPQFRNHWLTGMRAKLGLAGEEPDDEQLITDLLLLMQEFELDYTNTFRDLTLGELNPALHDWENRWQTRQDKNAVRTHNPAVIPRNHRVEEALQAAENGDLSIMHNLLRVLKEPYAYRPDQEEYVKPPSASFCYKTFCGT